MEKADQNPGDDFEASGFGSYGAFSQAEEEEETSIFNEFGRFCGAEIGLGTMPALGNRGLLWQGGFPMFEFTIHYWFDFNYALNLSLLTARYYYESTIDTFNGTTNSTLSHVDISIFALGIGARYYIPTHDLTSTLTFAGPFLSLSGSVYFKTETSAAAGQNQDNSSALGFAIGGGFEFPLKPKSSYVDLEAKVHFVNFLDSYQSTFQTVGITDLSGFFLSIDGAILFTW